MIRARLVRRAAVPVIVVLTAATGLVIQLTGEHREHPGRRPPAVQARTPAPSSPGTATPSVTPGTLPTYSPVTPAAPATRTSSPSSTSATTPAESTTPERPARPTTAPTSPPQSGSLDSLLQQDGPVPDGVPAQLDLFLGGGQICSEEDFPAASVRAPQEPVVIPSVPVFCFEGFDTRRAVTFFFTTPDGAQDTLTVPAYAHHHDGLYYPVRPGSPTGRYRVRAVQGSTTATAYFQAVRARRPHLWIYPRYPAPGTTIDVYAGGFPPGRPTDLHLYACPGLTYRATQPIAIDARGEAHVALHTTSTTERTCYAVNSPLVYIPPDPPGLPGGPDNQAFWLQDPGPPEQPPHCESVAPRC